jgi:hypothetical protein
MKATLATMFLALAISAPAVNHAHAADAATAGHTKTSFEKHYSDVVNDALKAGNTIKTTCWADYCQKYLPMTYTDGFVGAYRLNYKNGEELREVCVGGLKDWADRNCASSSGAIWSEHFDASKKEWRTTATITDHFEEETPDGPSM